MPGETGALNIKYNTMRLGAFSKTVIVTSNAEGGNKILKIKGHIVASYVKLTMTKSNFSQITP